MTELLDALSHDFVRNAALAGLLVSTLCGVIGTFVVAKRLVFISGGISHAAFGGLGICHFLGAPPLLGALAAALSCALVLGALGEQRVRSRDAAIGVLWAAGMALGIVFIDATPGFAPDLMGYLFGNILTVTPNDLWLALALDLLVLGVLVAFFKELVAVSFDEPFAELQGIPVRTVLTGMLIGVALTVVVLIQLVGIILVIALLTIPPLLGLRFARSFSGALTISAALGAAISLGGLAVSYHFDLPTGPTIVLLGAALLGMVSAVDGVRARVTSRADPPARRR